MKQEQSYSTEHSVPIRQEMPPVFDARVRPTEVLPKTTSSTFRSSIFYDTKLGRHTVPACLLVLALVSSVWCTPLVLWQWIRDAGPPLTERTEDEEEKQNMASNDSAIFYYVRRLSYKIVLPTLWLYRYCSVLPSSSSSNRPSSDPKSFVKFYVQTSATIQKSVFSSPLRLGLPRRIIHLPQ